MTPDELWNIFDETFNTQAYLSIHAFLNIKKMMTKWTDQGSYPVLYVENINGKVHFTQVKISFFLQ